MNSFLLWIGGLLVAVLGLLFAAPYIIDWNAYRGVFEEEASRALGRDVRVGGRVNLHLLPAPYVRFEKVRISDAGAFLGEPFFRAEAFTLWLSAAPLLRGAIEAKELELDRPVLRLAVDAEGRGNWQALKLSAASLPFVPNEIVLQQIRVRDGTVSLKTPNAVEPFVLSGIDGELSASALDGPYRFRGNISWQGTPRDLRIATAAREADGRLRFKANVRAPSSGNAYTFDGMLSELTTRGTYAGTLTAQIPFQAAGLTIPAGETAPRPRTGRAQAGMIDLKSTVTGDIDGTVLSDIALAFELDGKPQLMSGEATANWRQGMRSQTRLSSRWLDLDQLAGNGDSRPPLELARGMIGHLSGMLPADGSSLATIEVEQLNLAGEAVSDLRLVLARAGGLTSIGELSAALPGNAKAELRGTLSGSGRESLLDGEIVLRGSSYQRFAKWAGVPTSLSGQSAAAAYAEAPFTLASRLRLLPDRLEMTAANVELGGAQLRADVDWQWGGERQLALRLDGALLDVTSIAPGLLDIPSATVAALTSAAPTSAEPEPPSPATGTSKTALATQTLLSPLTARLNAIRQRAGELRLAIRAQTLVDGPTTIKDVDADILVASDSLRIQGLKFTTIQGARIDLQGDLKSIANRTDGHLKGWLTAPTPDAISAVATTLPASVSSLIGPWLARVSATDFGFSVVFGGAPADQVVVRANGLIDGVRLDSAVTLTGGIEGWREAPISATASLDGPGMTGVAQRILGLANSRGPAATLATDERPGTLHFKAAGPTATSLMSLVDFQSSGLQLNYNGRAALTSANAVELSGSVDARAADAADLIVASGAPRRPRLDGAAVRGRIGLSRKDGILRLASDNLTIANTRVGGTVTVASNGDRLGIEGRLIAGRASIPGLLGLVLDGRQHSNAQTDSGAATGASPWPDALFTLVNLDAMTGNISISTPALILTGDLEIAEANLSLAFEPGRILIQNLTGSVLGGQILASAAIDGTPTGTGLNLTASLTDAKLERLAPGGAKPRSLGAATVNLTMTSKALSPSALISTLTGKGEIVLTAARAPGIAPAAVNTAANVLIESPDALTREGLEAALRRELGAGELALGARKLPIVIADGVLKVAPIQIDSVDGRVRNVTTLDLASMRAESEWQLSPQRPLPVRQGAPKRDPLPAVSVVWTGPVATLARSEPRLAIDALERELAIRKAERDVERLDEMRRLDEERMRQGNQQGSAPDLTHSTPPRIITAPFSAPAQPPAPSVLPAPQRGPNPGAPSGPRPQNADSNLRTLQDRLMGQQ